MNLTQKVRRAFLFVSFLFFPLTFLFFSPAIIIFGAKNGIITGSFIVFISLFIISLVAGRLFCAWLCPAGGMQEACSLLPHKSIKRGKRVFIKFVIWIPWFAFILYLLFTAHTFRGFDFFYQIKFMYTQNIIGLFIVYFFVIIIILSLSLIFGKRSFCNYACWISPFMIIGKSIAKIIRLPVLYIKTSPDNCIDCKICNKKCPMSLPVNEMVKDGVIKSVDCILCKECIYVCPKNVLKMKFGFF